MSFYKEKEPISNLPLSLLIVYILPKEPVLLFFKLFYCIKSGQTILLFNQELMVPGDFSGQISTNNHSHHNALPTLLVGSSIVRDLSE